MLETAVLSRFTTHTRASPPASAWRWKTAESGMACPADAVSRTCAVGDLPRWTHSGGAGSETRAAYVREAGLALADNSRSRPVKRASGRAQNETSIACARVFASR